MNIPFIKQRKIRAERTNECIIDIIPKKNGGIRFKKSGNCTKEDVEMAKNNARDNGLKFDNDSV
ncbi:MAG: hypothetical protein AABY22_15195 [Nanoarchaeota archaeon]